MNRMDETPSGEREESCEKSHKTTEWEMKEKRRRVAGRKVRS
jgi:hypothetical protein